MIRFSPFIFFLTVLFIIFSNELVTAEVYKEPPPVYKDIELKQQLDAKKAREKAAQEAEEKRIVEQKTREQAAREAEEKRIAKEKIREQAAREAKEKRIAKQKAREQADREAEEKLIAEKREREQADREAEEKLIAAIEAEKKRIVEEQKREKAREQAACEAEEKRIIAIETEKKRIAEEKAVANQKAKKKRIADEEVRKIQERMTYAISRKEYDKDVNFMLKIIDEFEQYNKFASSTSRIALAIPINNLLNIKIKFESYQPVSSCYFSSKIQLLKWMDFTIKSYYSFLHDETYQLTENSMLANKEFKLFWLNFPDYREIFICNLKPIFKIFLKSYYPIFCLITLKSACSDK